jgi:hypothetical protein
MNATIAQALFLKKPTLSKKPLLLDGIDCADTFA